MVMVGRHALTMVLIGLAAGLRAPRALTRVTTSLLFEVSALDPFAFVGSRGRDGRRRCRGGADPRPPGDPCRSDDGAAGRGTVML